MSETAPPERRTRPKNRRALVVVAAGRLFHRSGYHQVSMSDIAAEVGITGPALYRHFPSKQALLGTVLTQGIEAVAAVAHGVDADLQSLVAALAGSAVEHRTLGLLWQRDGRNLPADQRLACVARIRSIVEDLAGYVEAHTPSRSAHEAEFLAWCILSVLASPSYHRSTPPDDVLEGWLARIALAVAETDVDLVPPGPSVSGKGAAGNGPRRSSRREHLLQVTIERFARSGFGGVTMEEIGAAAGISAPSIYNHFDSKSDLLAAAVTRGGEAIHLRLSEILATSGSAEEALTRLVHDYADFTTRQPAMFHVLISELPYLAPEQRSHARRTQRDYVTEWVQLLRTVRPELDDVAARCRVHAAFTIANDLARTGVMARGPGLAAGIAAACERALRS